MATGDQRKTKADLLEEVVELRHRLAMEELVTDISTRFVNVSADQMTGQIRHTLEALGQFTGVDRCYLNLVSSDRSTVIRVYEWCAAGSEPRAGMWTGLKLEPFQWSMTRLTRSEIIHVPRVADLPPEARAEKTAWQARRTQSLLAVPLFAGETFVGYLGFDAEGRELSWSDEVIRQLKLVAEILCGALDRNRGEMALRASEARYRALIEDQTEFVCRWEPDTTLTFVNQAYCRYFGKSRQELIGSKFLALVLEEDRPAVQARITRLLETLTPENPSAAHEHRTRDADGQVRWLQWINRAIFDEIGELVEFQDVGRDITQRKEAVEMQQRYTTQLEGLRRVGLELTAHLELDPLLHFIASQAIELMGGSAGGLFLYREQGDVLEWVTSVGPHMPPPGSTLSRGQGLAGQVLESREQLVVNGYQDWDDRVGIFDAHPWTSAVAVPVRWADQFLGVLEVLADGPHSFTIIDAALLSMFATQAAIGVRNANLLETEQEQRNLAQALSSAVAVVSSTLDLEEVLGHILEQVERVVPGDAFNIMLLEGDVIRPIRWRGYEKFGYQEKMLETARPVQEIPGFQYMAETGKPWVIPDVSKNPDWVSVPDQDWLRSYVGSPIYVEEQVIGYLNVDGTRVGQFGPKDAQRLRAFASHTSVAIENARLYQQATIELAEREKAESQIQASLREKEVLLKEVHHRVKNNLNVICSLLDLQAETVKDAESLQLFHESRHRVRSMALIHERLYQVPDIARVDTALYVNDLTQFLLGAYSGWGQVLQLDVNIDDVPLDIDTAIPCGLIINELVSNALKHAFPTGGDCRSGRVEVTLHSNPDQDQLVLTVSDNGVGFPPDLDFRRTQSLGLQLVVLLTRQLQGQVECFDGPSGGKGCRGTSFTVTFPGQEPKNQDA